MKREIKHSEMLSMPNPGQTGPALPDKYESAVVLLRNNHCRIYDIVFLHKNFQVLVWQYGPDKLRQLSYGDRKLGLGRNVENYSSK